MKKIVRRDRADDALSFLEYLVLAVLVIAAAVAGMTFLGASDGRHNNSAAPTSNSLRLRVAARAAGPGGYSVHPTRSSFGPVSPFATAVPGCIES